MTVDVVVSAVVSVVGLVSSRGVVVMVVITGEVGCSVVLVVVDFVLTVVVVGGAVVELTLGCCV